MIPQDAGKPDPLSHVPPPHLPREGGPIAGRIGEAPLRPQLPPPPAPAAPPGLSAAPDIWSLMLALRHRWISAVILGGLLGSLAAIGAYYLLAPKNTASATVQVAFFLPRMNTDRPSEQTDFKTFAQTTAAKLASRPVIWAALKRSEVRQHNFLGDRDVDSVILAVQDDLKIDFKDNSEYITIQFTHTDPQVAIAVTNAIKDAYFFEYDKRENDKRADKFKQRDELVTNTKGTIDKMVDKLKEFNKSVFGDKTDEVYDPLIHRIKITQAQNSLKSAQENQQTLRIKIAQEKANLKVFEAQVAALRRKDKNKGKSGADDELDAYVPKLRLPELSRLDIDEMVAVAVAADAGVRKLRTDSAPWERVVAKYKSDGVRLDNLGYKNALKHLKELQSQVRQEEAEVAARERKRIVSEHRQAVKKAEEAHAEMISKLKAEAEYRARMAPAGQRTLTDDEVGAMRDRSKAQINEMVVLDERLTEEIKRLGKIAALQGPGQEYDQLVREIQDKQTIYKGLQEKLENERLELKAALRVTKGEEAALMKKETKKQLLATGVAPLVMLCGVCGGLALLEHRKRKVRSAVEISRGLGIRVVGAVPRMAHLERHLVGPTGESELEGTPVMESIDAIRTRLLHEADVRSTRVVMVTSATSGEGKTTLAAALASSLARAGRRTLLLDGDLRSPRVHELFEIPQQPGFSEVLLAEVEMADAAVESMQENLAVMPAGQWDREVLLALSRDGLEGVFEKLSEEFDFIVVDSHPVLNATDALLLGRQADAVVLSVLRETSQLPRVYAAYQQLTTIGIRVLGAVVNGTDPEEVFATAAPAMATA